MLRAMLLGSLALLVPAVAQAGDLTVKVQPILVCADVGSSCAQLNLDTTATQRIWDQAGINIAFEPTIEYKSAFYNDQDIFVDGNGNNPSDEAHLLLRHYEAARAAQPNFDPQVLNMFFVNTLTRGDGGAINGLGLNRSNGMIVANFSTGPTALSVPSDIAAHEIGHNLGLVDVDLAGVPDRENLMQTYNRDTPASLAEISTNGVTGKDRLTTLQIATARAPLFTVDQASASFAVDEFTSGFLRNYLGDFGGCTAGTRGCVFAVTTPISPTPLTLGQVKLRFSGDIDVGLLTVQPYPTADSPVDCTFTAANQTFAGGVESTVTFGVGCFATGKTSSVLVDFGQRTTEGARFYTDPFSIEFDFAGCDPNNVYTLCLSSTAFYSASGRRADSDAPGNTYAIIGPTVPRPGFVLPQTDQFSLDYLAPAQAQPVPEPASLLLLTLPLAFFIAMHRRET